MEHASFLKCTYQIRLQGQPTLDVTILRGASHSSGSNQLGPCGRAHLRTSTGVGLWSLHVRDLHITIVSRVFFFNDLLALLIMLILLALLTRQCVKIEDKLLH